MSVEVDQVGPSEGLDIEIHRRSSNMVTKALATLLGHKYLPSEDENGITLLVDVPISPYGG